MYFRLTQASLWHFSVLEFAGLIIIKISHYWGTKAFRHNNHFWAIITCLAPYIHYFWASQKLVEQEGIRMQNLKCRELKQCAQGLRMRKEQSQNLNVDSSGANPWGSSIILPRSHAWSHACSYSFPITQGGCLSILLSGSLETGIHWAGPSLSHLCQYPVQR